MSGDPVKEDMDCLGPWKPSLDAWISCAPFERLLGMEILRAESGKATLTMPFVEGLAQGAGLMHGGALVSLADTAVTMAIKSMLDEGSHFVTAKMSAKFLKPVLSGLVRAEASTEFTDERTIVGLSDVFDQEGQKVFVFESIFKIPRSV